VFSHGGLDSVSEVFVNSGFFVTFVVVVVSFLVFVAFFFLIFAI
jgi:hypothetical protein